jgi:PAS domain S-box-containing protein
MRSRIVRRLRKSAAPFALSNLALALIVTIAYRFHLNTAIVLLCLLVIVLHALADGFVSSGIVSIIAGASLLYFFVPPIFSFRIVDPLQVVDLGVFLIVSNGLAWLVSRAHGTLRDKQRQLALAESAAHIAVWDRDLKTNVIAFSGEYNKIYGLAAGRRVLTYDEWLRMIHPEDREQLRAHNQDALTRTYIWDEEFRIVWPDGSVHWLLGKGTVFRDETGRPVRIAGVNIDITERKRAEADLRKSEERLRFAQQVASIGTFDWNIETGVNTWTPELESIYGLPRGGFSGTQSAWEDLIHPDDRALAVQRVKEAFETGEPEEAEWRIVLPDGRVRWLFGRWQVFKNAAGKPLRMMGVNMDVTNRNYMKEALRQGEERFRLAIQATNDAVWDIDLGTGTVSWNETYATLYGRPPETSKSWQWWIDRIHPEDRERTSGGLRSAISGSESTWTCEYRFQRLDGAWAYIYDRAYIARDPSGGAWRVIGAMQDLTQRKRAEAELRESEERFRRVFEEGPLGFGLVGRNYHFEKVNGAFCQMMGYAEVELLQMSFVDITHPDDVQADLELAERLFRSEIPFYKLRKRYVKKNGEIIWINLTGSVIRDKEGEVMYGLAMIEDITEVKRTQEEALAGQKLESLGVLAGGIAHDFNNLLGGILASTELALMERAEGLAVEEELQRIKTASIRGAEIVRELMIYAGEESPAFELVDISALVNEMLHLLKVSISKHTILKIELGQDLPFIHANPAQIRRLVMNLVTNASEAIGEGPGTIRAATAKVKVGPDYRNLGGANLPEGNYVRLEVSDTGSGMTPEVQARIFDPFFTTKPMGRGLGLAAVRGIIHSHGGTINVESACGQGTLFQILLPCIHQPVRERKDITVTPLNREAGSVTSSY